MSKLQDFIEVAKKEVGTVEEPVNKTKYGKFTGKDGLPWCGSFLMWCAAQAKVKLPNLVWTPGGAEAFKGKGAWLNHETAIPKPGDIAFFDFVPGGAKIEHVGLVIQNNGDGTITTIEGNTVPDKKPKGNQANGGEVCVKVRAYRASNNRKLTVYVAGFGRPKYDA